MLAPLPVPHVPVGFPLLATASGQTACPDDQIPLEQRLAV
jgi:hypothetical protein